MSAPPFATVSSPLKERVEGEFVKRLRKIVKLRKIFPRINPQYVNEACPAPKITCVAQPQGEYAVQSGIFRVQLAIEIQVPDPPENPQDDNAKLLELAAGLVRGVISKAQSEGVFGVIIGQENERKTENTRSRYLTAQIITT